MTARDELLDVVRKLNYSRLFSPERRLLNEHIRELTEDLRREYTKLMLQGGRRPSNAP